MFNLKAIFSVVTLWVSLIAAQQLTITEPSSDRWYSGSLAPTLIFTHFILQVGRAKPQHSEVELRSNGIYQLDRAHYQPRRYYSQWTTGPHCNPYVSAISVL
jgi:hypothetical protein